MDGDHEHPGLSRILIPWDGSTPRDRVLELASVVGGENITVMMLPVTAAAASQPAAEPPAPTVGSRAAILRCAQHRLWSAPARACPSRVEYLPLPESAGDAGTIAGIAAEYNADLILVVTGCHTMRDVDPSCLATQLVLDSPIPVMVVRQEDVHDTLAPPYFTRVLIPLDDSGRALEALPAAAGLARRLGLPVQLLMVIDPERILPPAYARDAVVQAEMVAALTQGAHWALTRAERILTRDGIAVQSELVYGPVVSSLETAVHDNDLLVMTTHGVDAIRRDPLSGVAAHLIAGVANPLVIMRSSAPVEATSHGRALPQRTDSRSTPVWTG